MSYARAPESAAPTVAVYSREATKGGAKPPKSPERPATLDQGDEQAQQETLVKGRGWALSNVTIGAEPPPGSAPKLPNLPERDHVSDVLASQGEPLEVAAREPLEARFQRSFEQVRVHKDAQAAQSARSVNAKAYAIGNHVVFGAGQYAPTTHAGKLLLAHELAHVVQQSQGGRVPSLLPGSSLEQDAAQAASSAVHGSLGQVSVTGRSSPGLAREPLSLNSSVDPKVLSDKDLENETMEVNIWLSKHGASSDPDSDRMASQLNALEAEVHKRHAKPPQPKKPLLPTVKGEGKEELLRVMAEIDGIRPSDVASGIFTLSIDGEEKNLTPDQVAQVRKQAASILKDHIGRIKSKADGALAGYQSQQAIDKDHWIVAPIVKTLGRVQDPGPYLTSAVSKAQAAAESAYAAIAAGNLSQAATFLATGESSAISADKLWQAYFQGIISAGEMTVTALEITRDAAFLTLGILATIATAGGAAGALGVAEGGAATTTAFGVDLGVSGATAANAIAVGAPVAANFAEAGAKVAMGDKVDWGALVVDTLIQVVIAKFGGKVTSGITKSLLGNPATESLASKVTEKVVHTAVMHAGSTALTTAAQDAYRALKGQDVTWQTFVDDVIARLTDPKSLAIVAVTGALTSAAEAKYGGGAKPSGPAGGAVGARPTREASAPLKPAPEVEGVKATDPAPLTPSRGSVAQSPAAKVEVAQTSSDAKKVVSLDEYRQQKKSTPDREAGQQVVPKQVEAVHDVEMKMAANDQPRSGIVAPVKAVAGGGPPGDDITPSNVIPLRPATTTSGSGSSGSGGGASGSGSSSTIPAGPEGTAPSRLAKVIPIRGRTASAGPEDVSAAGTGSTATAAPELHATGETPATAATAPPVATSSGKPDISGTFSFSENEVGGKTVKTASGRLGKPGDVHEHRSPSAQSNVSSGTGDDAGHLIGNRFGAPGGQENLSPQNWRANRSGTFKRLENMWARKLKAGYQIDVRVTDTTNAGEDRPYRRDVQWTETAPNGSTSTHEETFANTDTPESRSKRAVAPTVPEGNMATVHNMEDYR